MGDGTLSRFEDFKEQGTISDLQFLEEADYLRFHEISYREDLEVAERLIPFSPRWGVVAGYYAMHDATKLFLGKVHKLKLSGKFIHEAVIEALRTVLKDEEPKKRALELLEEARETYQVFDSWSNEAVIPLVLRKSKEERGKAQYYSRNFQQVITPEYQKKALSFLNGVVRPFLELMGGMMNAA